MEGRKEKPVIRVGNLEAVRDFTDVRDMVKAYLLAILQGQDGEVYNLGSRRGLKIRQVLDKLVNLSDKKLTIETDPSKMRPIDIPRIVIDASKFNKLTGWQPEISAEESLEDTLVWWRGKVNG